MNPYRLPAAQPQKSAFGVMRKRAGKQNRLTRSKTTLSPWPIATFHFVRKLVADGSIADLHQAAAKLNALADDKERLVLDSFPMAAAQQFLFPALQYGGRARSVP
jgi:hypothetical protein